MKSAKDIQTDRLKVENFNLKYPEGQAVKVRKDGGEETITVTRSAAWMLGDHTAVIMLKGFSGGYSLDRVEAI